MGEKKDLAATRLGLLAQLLWPSDQLVFFNTLSHEISTTRSCSQSCYVKPIGLITFY